MTATGGYSPGRRPARRPRAFALATFALTVCAIGGSVPAAGAAPGCARSGKQVKRNAHVRVFRKGHDSHDASNLTYYACDLKKGRVTKLNPPADFGGGTPEIATMKLAGTRVGFAAAIPTGCCSEEEMDVVDATKKHRIRTYYAGVNRDYDIRVRKIALASNGDIAWTGRGCAIDAAGTGCIADDVPSAPAPPDEFQVWAAGHRHKSNEQRLLAHGSAITPGSIALTSTLVRWTDGGMPRQAPIP